MVDPQGIAPLAAGFGLSASLIVAIGAQNAFVLRQGLRREHVGAVVAACAAIDALLIAAGVAGLGAALGPHPALLRALSWLGAAVLAVYGVQGARRALHPAAVAPHAPLVSGFGAFGGGGGLAGSAVIVDGDLSAVILFSADG
jgi:L-lysine exporter family protein LysE/ArgO